VKQLFIIAGPNGAGKTTASFTILPEILKIKEFVNADEIAKGISPFNPEGAAFAAGRVMLNRISELLEQGESFAFETTLATRSYVSLIKRAQLAGYKVSLLFLALQNSSLALKRVQTRVKEGGHNVPRNVIETRYRKGLSNFFNLFQEAVDLWLFIDNTAGEFKSVARGSKQNVEIKLPIKWEHYKFAANGN
jgi:predicted ABC-type ATPase